MDNAGEEMDSVASRSGGTGISTAAGGDSRVPLVVWCVKNQTGVASEP